MSYSIRCLAARLPGERVSHTGWALVVDRDDRARPVRALLPGAHERALVKPAAAVPQPRPGRQRPLAHVVAWERPRPVRVAEEHVRGARGERRCHARHRLQAGAPELLAGERRPEGPEPGE